jgi:hypothetical protein
MSTGGATRAQLKNGAEGIAYRAEQLAGVAALFHQRIPVGVRDAGFLTTIQNALVESARVNARALAWFFTRESDVNTSMFPSNWEDDVVSVARKIGPISQHLGHASTGSEEAEQHPGRWPIPELAVILVGGHARFVQALDRNNETYEVNWFTPSPVDTYHRDLTAVDPLSSPTEVSDNPSVAKLTKALQHYLQGHGLQTP